MEIDNPGPGELTVDDDIFKDDLFGVPQEEETPPAPAEDPYRDYSRAKTRYYRDVLRIQDKDFIRLLTKVPDDWDEYESRRSKDTLTIGEETKLRLSDIKKMKSWELKFESLYVYFIVTMENTLVECLNYRSVTPEVIDEGIESVNSIMVEIGSDLLNFKNLLLSLAKRSVSDLYYLMVAYYRFFKRMSYAMEREFDDFCRDALAIMEDNRRVGDIIAALQDIETIITPFFDRSAHLLGWRLNEFSLKQYIEGKGKSELIRHDHLKKILTMAYSLKMRVRRAHDFLAYYYNAKDGKLYRYNYIISELDRKYRNGKVPSEAIEGFREIHGHFRRVAETFHSNGLDGFGPGIYTYERLLEFIHKCGKVLEFIYLRSMMYNDLNDIRASILRRCDDELIRIHDLKTKYRRK
ncbi:MAG: hypothetical protein JXA20_01425 [Spirochaetes bacterium]|nr:hypothetical protein [Spirochaetota bacterium]